MVTTWISSLTTIKCSWYRFSCVTLAFLEPDFKPLIHSLSVRWRERNRKRWLVHRKTSSPNAFEKEFLWSLVNSRSRWLCSTGGLHQEGMVHIRWGREDPRGISLTPKRYLTQLSPRVLPHITIILSSVFTSVFFLLFYFKFIFIWFLPSHGGNMGDFCLAAPLCAPPCVIFQLHLSDWYVNASQIWYHITAEWVSWHKVRVSF